MRAQVTPAAMTPMPVQRSEPEFTAFLLPHLTMPQRGPKCKLALIASSTCSYGYSIRGGSGSGCPCRKMPRANQPSPTRPSTKSWRSGPLMGRSGRRSWPVSGLWRPSTTSIPVGSMATGPTPGPKRGGWHRLFRPQAPQGRESHRHHRQPGLCVRSRPRGSRP